MNLAGIDAEDLHRGLVLTDDPAVAASDRLLVHLSVPLPDRARARVHLGTAAADATIGRSGRDALDLPDGSVGAIVRVNAPLAVAIGDRLVLRRGSGTDRIVGGLVLDAAPPRGISRRRQSNERVDRLVSAVLGDNGAAIDIARLELHGAVGPIAGPLRLAAEVEAAVADAVVAAVDPVATLTQARAVAARALRRHVTIDRSATSATASAVVDRLVNDGRLVRDGAEVRRPGSAPTQPRTPDPDLVAAMDRLERALSVFAPPDFGEAARSAACPPDGIRELERAGRIVVLEPDLAYAASTYRQITNRALALATGAPLTPAALRDATGTSRRYVLAILADLDRRGILRRTAYGHVPGPRAPAPTSANT